MDINSIQSSQGINQSSFTSAKTDSITESKNVKNIQQQPVGDNKAPSDSFSIEELNNVSKEMNNYMDSLQTNLGFFIKDGPGRQVIAEIKNRETGEVIRQFPSEGLLAIREKMAELTGLIFDQKI